MPRPTSAWVVSIDWGIIVKLQSQAWLYVPPLVLAESVVE